MEEGISSIATVPVVRGKLVCGFFGIDCTKGCTAKGHDWSTNEKALAVLNHAAFAISACLYLGQRLPRTQGMRIPVDTDIHDSTMLQLMESTQSIEDMADKVVLEFEKIRKHPDTDR